MGKIQNFISQHWRKIIVAIILIMIIVIISVMQIASFIKENTSNASENYYNAGKRVIQIVDDYLDFKLTSDEAEEQLREIKDRLPDVDISSDAEHENWLIESEVSILYYDFSLMSSQDSDILEDRNELADTLKLPQR